MGTIGNVAKIPFTTAANVGGNAMGTLGNSAGYVARQGYDLLSSPWNKNASQDSATATNEFLRNTGRDWSQAINRGVQGRLDDTTSGIVNGTGQAVTDLGQSGANLATLPLRGFQAAPQDTQQGQQQLQYGRAQDIYNNWRSGRISGQDAQQQLADNHGNGLTSTGVYQINPDGTLGTKDSNTLNREGAGKAINGTATALQFVPGLNVAGHVAAASTQGIGQTLQTGQVDPAMIAGNIGLSLLPGGASRARQLAPIVRTEAENIGQTAGRLAGKIPGLRDIPVVQKTNLTNTLQNGTDQPVYFGKVNDPQISNLRNIVGEDTSNQVYAHPNAINHIAEGRINGSGMSAQNVTNTAYDAIHNKNSQVIPSNTRHNAQMFNIPDGSTNKANNAMLGSFDGNLSLKTTFPSDISEVLNRQKRLNPDELASSPSPVDSFDTNTLQDNTPAREISDAQVKPNNSIVSNPTQDVNTANPTGTLQTGLKKYKTVNQGGTVKEVDGQPIDIVPGVNTFVHKDENGNWVVSESNTGRSLTNGGYANQQYAIKAARDTIADYGADNVHRVIDNADQINQPTSAKTPDTQTANILNLQQAQVLRDPTTGATEARTDLPNGATAVTKTDSTGTVTTNSVERVEPTQVAPTQAAVNATTPDLADRVNENAFGTNNQTTVKPYHQQPHVVRQAIDDQLGKQSFAESSAKIKNGIVNNVIDPADIKRAKNKARLGKQYDPMRKFLAENDDDGLAQLQHDENLNPIYRRLAKEELTARQQSGRFNNRADNIGDRFKNIAQPMGITKINVKAPDERLYNGKRSSKSYTEYIAKQTAIPGTTNETISELVPLDGTQHTLRNGGC